VHNNKSIKSLLTTVFYDFLPSKTKASAIFIPVNVTEQCSVQNRFNLVHFGYVCIAVHLTGPVKTTLIANRKHIAIVKITPIPTHCRWV